MKTGKHQLPDDSVLEKLRKIAHLAERGYKGQGGEAADERAYKRLHQRAD